VSDLEEFSPIVEQGDMPPRRLRSRFTGGTQLPPLQPNQVRVFMDDNGQAIDQSMNRSAGERYWASARKWAVIDVDEHTMEFAIALEDQTGRAGFVATLTVAVSVTDPAAAIRSPIGGLRTKIQGRLKKAVTAATDDVEIPGAGDHVTLLANTQRRMERALAQLVGDEVEGLPAGLSARIDEVTLAFDEATQAHRDQLLHGTREITMIDLGALQDQADDTRRIGRHRRWSTYLLEYLQDPAARPFQAALFDPSPEQLDQIVKHIETSERADRELMLERLENLADNDNMRDLDEERRIALETISSTLASRRFDTQGQLEPSEPDALPEATVSDDHDDPDGDRSW
jgi:hypothetical protein